MDVSQMNYVKEGRQTQKATYSMTFWRKPTHRDREDQQLPNWGEG